MFLDGFNSQLSDIDFVHTTQLIISRSNYLYDVSLPSYFRKNIFLAKLFKASSEFKDHYLNFLDIIAT